MINLEDAVEPLRELIGVSLKSFASEQPEIAWSTFALYACPWGGWVTTSFDTEENSTQIVDQISTKGLDWYGEDEWGRFNNNCPDFRFPEWRVLNLTHWRTEYEESEPIHVRDLSGQDHFIGDENEAINGLAFSFLQSVLGNQLKSMTERQYLPNGRYRVGVQLLDSAFSEFWRSKNNGTKE